MCGRQSNPFSLRIASILLKMVLDDETKMFSFSTLKINNTNFKKSKIIMTKSYRKHRRNKIFFLYSVYSAYSGWRKMFLLRNGDEIYVCKPSSHFGTDRVKRKPIIDETFPKIGRTSKKRVETIRNNQSFKLFF